MNFYELAITINRLSDDVPKRAHVEVRRVMLSIDQQLVTATPVDTGFARSNWRASIGGPVTGTILPYSPGRGLGRGEQTNAAVAMAQARAIAAGSTPGQDLFITNNTPYLGLLDSGSSAQAAAGFVRRAISSGIAAIRSSSP